MSKAFSTDLCGYPDDGEHPIAGLVAGDMGALYGTTFSGGGPGGAYGTGNNGTVFKLFPSKGGYVQSTLYRFRGGKDGDNPVAGLTVDANGAVFGTTPLGGSTTPSAPRCCGTVFKLTPSRSGYAENILYRFRGTNCGAYTYWSVASAAKGVLFGRCHSGDDASDLPSIFKLTPIGLNSKSNVLYRYHESGPLYIRIPNKARSLIR